MKNRVKGFIALLMLMVIAAGCGTVDVESEENQDNATNIGVAEKQDSATYIESEDTHGIKDAEILVVRKTGCKFLVLTVSGHWGNAVTTEQILGEDGLPQCTDTKEEGVGDEHDIKTEDDAVGDTK